MDRSWIFLLQCLVIALLGRVATEADRDPYSKQPRIIVQNGNLILRSGLNGNISLASSGQGTIQVNGVDLGKMASSIQPGNNIGSNRLGDILNSIADQRNSIHDLSEQVSMLEENITAVANKVNKFIGTGQEKISNRALRRVMSKVKSLGDKVNTLTQLLTENECNSNPCRNGGTCVDTYNAFICNCPDAWEGPTCESDVNECGRYAGTSFGCQNGATCINTHGGYNCNCPTNWHGIHCTEKFDDCSTASHQELCGHGTCIDVKRAVPGQPNYRCICDAGWQKSSNSPACSEDIDECSGPDRKCSQNPFVTCINLPGSFHCGHCPTGYTGNGHSCSDINECEVNNGGCSMQPFVQCMNTQGSRMCGSCPTGYVGNGVQCTFLGACSVNRGGCHPLATCSENTAITGTYRVCTCPAGYVGNGEGLTGCVQSAGMSCAVNPCRHGTCQMVGQSVHCTCEPGYFGTLCDRQEYDPCSSSPCENGGTCTTVQRTGVNSFTCICRNGYEGPTCSKTQRCGSYLTGSSGFLEFPDQHYDHKKSCAWVISVDSDKVVQVKFTNFNVGNIPNCRLDFLQLNDGSNAGSRVLGRYCRQTLKDQIVTSTHNELYLWFLSQMTIPGTGFALNWTAVDPVCGGYLNISEYGAVNSPGYPGLYPNNRTCEWLVRVPIGKRIQFHFATLKLEHHENCSFDYLKVYDGATDRDPEIGKYCTTVTPAPLLTSGHSATLVFHSDAYVQDTGFHITYSAQSTVQGCGGLLTNPVGKFSSPNFPDVYENDLSCEWLIRIQPENRISLVFKEFNLESHTNCLFDFVEIYEGNSDAAPLVGRYCGSTIPSGLYSSSNQLFIRFRSDNSLVDKGFKAEYKTICGGVYTESSGVLSSPYYPENYPARASCIYDIRMEPGYLINITFFSLTIEEHANCLFDYLQVRDGNSEDSPLIAQLCGDNVPDNILSTYNFLWLRFETDGSVQNKGFYAQYEAVEIGCGGVLTEPSGQFSSPRHPDRYPHSIVCSWYLKAPPGFIIQLTFTSFILEPDKECRFDYVHVEELGGTKLGRYCGTTKPPVLTSMDNSLFVKFVADASVSRDGFTATYQFFNALEACGGTYYQESGVIRSPGFPDRYPHSLHCIWVLQAPSQKQISLNVTSFHIEGHTNCRYDYLEIRNGGYESSPLIGRYCDRTILQVIRSHSNSLRLEFRTDASTSAPGFEIYFDSTSMGCGGKLTSPRGTIISPNYPQPYPFNADCEWLIQTSSASIISLTIINIDIEEHEGCLFDYVQVFDGNSENSKSLLRICNNHQIPGTLVSSGNFLLVRFRSDASEEAGGFQLAYQALCNNKLTKMRGVIESPNFPYTYPHNHNCTWTIEAPMGNNVSLVFSHLFLETAESCDADYVEILQIGKFGDINSLEKFCGNTSTPPGMIETSSNVAIVRFVTDQSVSREGFRIEWAVKGCGGEIYEKPYGNITSPNYPHGYATETACYWHIWYAPDYRVELTVDDLDLEGQQECNYDYLRVYGGEDENSPRLLNACEKIEGSQVITSHGNHMVVKFHSDHSVTRRGFVARFRKISSVCGGKFTATESTIMSPNFPNVYNANDECNWLIQVDKTHLVVLEFYDFDLPPSEDCTEGYLAVYDGSNSSAPVLLKHCGNKPEGVITSTGNNMLVRLVADGENVGKGFRAHYKTGCGQRLLADDGGVITSPNYPNTLYRGSNCSWIIYTSNPDEKVNLIITHLHIPDDENCTYTSLLLMDGDMDDSPVIGQYCGHRSPPPILSRGNIVHLILVRGGIFRAAFGLASTHCGGSFTSIQGTFSTPGYPYNYDINMECVWTIEAAVGNKVHLTFESMSLEDSDHCNKDYVEIHENDEAGRFIGRYCGNRIPSNVTSASKLWIKFKSDDVSTEVGFMAHYELNHGTIWNGTEGEIASPGYPNIFNQEGVSTYTWNIFVPSHLFVNVRFLQIGISTLSDSMSCSAYVQIYDGIDDEAADLGQFCGFQVPEPVVSTGSAVFIRYQTNYYYTSSFHLRWNAATESGISVDIPGPSSSQTCWEELQLNATEEITLTSPNYPENYPNSINCTYLLRAPHHQHVELNITELQVEFVPVCNFDRLEIYYLENANVDEWRLNSTVCGRENNIFLSSPTNLMKLVFITDKFVNYKGFHSVAKSHCGVRFRENFGVITSDYILPELRAMTRYGKLECEYSILVRPRRTIRILFETFNVPSDAVCSTNYILFRNGGSDSSPMLGNGKYCGVSYPTSLETSSNEAYIKVVVSSITFGTPNFKITYSELSMGCGGRLYITEEMGYVEIASPNYPNPPIHDTECIWTVVSPTGTRMRIDFDSEFHMSQNCYSGDDVEFLEILDGGTEIAPPLHRFCGHDQPSSVMSTGSALYVRYVTAVDSPEAGFKAKIGIAACGGTISSFSDVIKSPNYPKPYGNGQECEWVLKMKMGYHIILQLHDFDTPNPPMLQNCSATDYLEIRNFDAQGEVLGTFCGALGNVSRIINVPAPQAYVKFKSNSGRTGKGFLMYMLGNFNDGCGGLVEGTSGVINSPNYPNAVQGSRNCYWRITAPEGRRVKLTFLEFNLPRDESAGRCLSYVEAMNVTFWRRPVTDRSRELCGSELPAPIDSSTTYLSISFFTPGLAAGQGFSVQYSTEEENICGGVLPLPSGVISTPNLTVQNDSYIDCQWRISGDLTKNQTVVFRFDVFDVPGSLANYCRDGAVYMLAGNYFLGRYCENFTSDVVMTTPMPSTTLRLISTISRPIRGIHGYYNVSNCGGILSGQDAEITSPGYPDGYPPSTDCHWILRVPDGETITLYLEIRMESDCEKDYVLIRNGYHNSSPVRGKLCGEMTPVPIQSSSSVITVLFHSDEFGSAPGIRITTTEMQRGCGGLVHAKIGNFSSPNYPSHYDNNVECKWTVEYIPGYTVQLQFVGRFDLEMDNNCEKDYLLIEQYEADNTWKVLGKKCGSSTPETIISKTNKVRVTFHTNDRITGDGFSIKHSTVCGGNFTDLSGDILSPNYPGFYDDNLNCTYTIGKSHQYVSISFDDYFSIEGNNNCVYDYVQIQYKNGTSDDAVQGPYCGTIAPAGRTLQGPVTLRLITDYSYTAHGFKAHYEILDCGATLTEPYGMISTPKTTTEFLNRMDCTWQILAPSDKVIALRFSYLDININYNCWENFLEIIDGLYSGPSIGKLCGNSTPVVKSTGNVLTLRLHLTSMKALKGFSAAYYTTYGVNQGCGGSLSSSSGEIQSLDSDSDGLYEPNLDCSWLIIGKSADEVIQLTFDTFDVEASPNNTCIYDYLELRDDIYSETAGLIGKYCGSTLPSSFITSGNTVHILFHSDSQTNKAGFKLRFQSISSPCGPSSLISRQEPLTLTSPGYPNPYPINLRCKWIISRNTSTPYGSWAFESVRLSIKDMNVSCEGDYVELYKLKMGSSYSRASSYGRNVKNVKTVRLCGGTPVRDVVIQSGAVVLFHSNSVNSGAKGFNISYKDASCNRTYTEDNGVIVNSGYPAVFNTELNCAMKVTASAGKTVSAYFTKIELHPDCTISGIKVYDGENNTAPLIGAFCGYSTPDPIFSTGTSLYFELNMLQSIGLFHIIYMTTDKGRGCGGRILADRGVISSPLYPDAYNKDGECTWYITVHGYHTVQMEFKAFLLNSSTGCDQNYVEIYDGQTGQTEDRAARYCGTDLPGVHNSRTNEVMVKYVSNANSGTGFLLTFEINPYAPDPTLSVIQRHYTEEDLNGNLIINSNAVN